MMNGICGDRSFLRILATVCTLTGSLMLTGCGRSDREADFIFVSAVESNTLDPQKMSWLHDIRTVGCLWEPLVRYKLPETAIEPAVAESWTISDDKLTYTFTLRADAKWSNGDRVTAGDFVYAWRRALMPDFAADYSQLFHCIEGAKAFFDWRQEQITAFDKVRDDPAKMLQDAMDQFGRTVGIRAIDDRTLQVKLAQPTPYFLELCAFATFMPNHAASLVGIVKLNPDTAMLGIDAGYWTNPEKLITNGPYRLARHRFKRDLLVTQNPHYHSKAAMANTSILQKIIENPQTALLTYQNGEADWLPDIPSASSLAAELKQSGRKDVHAVPWAGTYFLSLNCAPTMPDGSKNPLGDVRVRKALSLAVDRQTIVEKITQMRQPIAGTFVPPDMIPGYAPPPRERKLLDIDRAKALLKDAGYTDPATLTGVTILYNTGGGHEQTMQAIKRMWQDNLGVVVNLEAMEVRSFRERLKTQKYTTARASWIGDYRDPTTFLDKYRTGGGNNDSKWSNAEYDALLNQAAGERDEAARMVLLRRAEAILLAEQPILPLYHYITLHVYDPDKVRNLHLNAWNFLRLDLVRVQP